MKDKIQVIKKYIFLHVCILVYTMSSVMTKYASQYEFLSIEYLCYMAVVFGILGVYAIIWQQAIKPFSPSVAYSNKSVTTIWTLIFSNLLFGEGITLNNIIGVIIIILGVIMVAKDE